MGCIINKVSSTSMHHTFHDLRIKYDHISTKYNESGIESPLKNKKRRNQYSKFILVREPMERLASCYKDKMVVHEKTGYIARFRNFVKKSSMRFSINGSVRKDMKKMVTFAEFLRALIIPKAPSKYLTRA